MHALYDVEQLVQRYADLVDSGEPASDELVDRAAAFLQLRFPHDYREFLKRWGTLSIGPVEIYGITPDRQFESSGVPNGIWYTHVSRKDAGLPKHLVVLYDNNGDQLLCLDATEVTRSPVVVWDLIDREIYGPRAESLFDFIADEVADALE